VIVRPEHVILESRAKSPANGANVRKGRIEDVVIVGGLDRKVRVVLHGGYMVESLVRSVDAGNYRTGMEISIAWPPDKTLIMPAM
jgi:hypothetical protein